MSPARWPLCAVSNDLPKSLSLRSASPLRFCLHTRLQRRAHLLIQHEQLLDALTLEGRTHSSIEPVDRAVKNLVRPAQVGRHKVGIVEIGLCRAQMTAMAGPGRRSSTGTRPASRPTRRRPTAYAPRRRRTMRSTSGVPRHAGRTGEAASHLALK